VARQCSQYGEPTTVTPPAQDGCSARDGDKRTNIRSTTKHANKQNTKSKLFASTDTTQAAGDHSG